MDYGSAPQRVSCRLDYIQTIPGVLKIIELLCDLLAAILGGAAPSLEGFTGHKGFFLFVSITALIITFIIFVLAMLNIQNLCLANYWPVIEMFWCGGVALFYFIASIVIATIAKYSGVYGGAAFFGFAAFITYVADAINGFRTYRGRPSNQNHQSYPPPNNQSYPPQNPTADRSHPTY